MCPSCESGCFLIGSRDGSTFAFPRPTHAPESSTGLFGDPVPYRTAWDAIGDLPAAPDEPALQVGGKWGALLPSIPEGQNYLWHTNRGSGLSLFGWRTRFWSFLLKLAKNRPSWTIQAQPGTAVGPFHWNNRKLSSREMCRLQTFPSDVTFDCGRGNLQKMLGNAVPSLLAEVLAHEIRDQLLGGGNGRGPLNLMPPVRSDVPAPEPVGAVPSSYLELVGDHPDHPGERHGAGRRQVSVPPMTSTLLLPAVSD